MRELIATPPRGAQARGPRPSAATGCRPRRRTRPAAGCAPRRPPRPWRRSVPGTTLESRSARGSIGWRADRALARLRLDGEPRPAVAQHHEVDLAAVRITQEAQLHAVAFGVLDEVAELQQMRRNEILEPCALILHGGPVPKVELLGLLDGPHARRAQGRDPEADVKVLEDG